MPLAKGATWALAIPVKTAKVAAKRTVVCMTGVGWGIECKRAW